MNHQNMLEYIKEGLLNFVFPLNCKVCGKPIRESRGYSICKDCFKTIKLIENPYCKKCGKPLIGTEFFLNNKDILCINCRKQHSYFNCARSVGVYEKALRKCIHLFKYYREKKLAKPLGKLLIDYLSKNKQLYQELDLIIPVPLHKNDLKIRGFNQSLLLSKEIGDYFSLPVEKNILIKKKITGAQIKLSKKEREKNLLNAFFIAEPERIKGKKLLLIDDVFTTGSTVNECSKELKKAQVKNICVLTLARGISEPVTVFP